MADEWQLVADDEVGVLVDLLSHDMLNNNQATLGYLELIQSSPGADRRTRDLAERAASQVRTSSMLLDGIRRFISSAKTGAAPAGAVDLSDMLAVVAQEVAGLFPHKRIRVDLSSVPLGARVAGAQYVQDLFTNLLMNLVQLDPQEEVRIEVSGELAGGSITVKVTAPTAVLPPGVDGGLFLRAGDMDASKMARVSGAVFASSIARALGGSMTSIVSDPDRNGGCTFELSLKGGSS